jgi:ferredoxin
MSRHRITTFIDARGTIRCGTCRVRVSHTAFKKRDGSVVDFPVHWPERAS